MNEAAKHHMTFLASGAEMVSRHARALPSRLPFKTAAQDELEDAERELKAALQKVCEAIREYNSKDIV
jgi:hypothetical protein